MSMKSLLSTKSLKTLKESLPSSGIAEIAERLDISISTVSRTLNGLNKKRQSEVVEEALLIVSREKEKSKQLLNRIESL